MISLTNVTGTKLTIDSFTINGDSLPVVGQEVADGNTVTVQYDKKGWNDFQQMELTVTLGIHKYQVNLNKGHYFGGGDYRYPGQGSDVNYVLMGTTDSQSNIVLMEVYRQSGAFTFIYNSDSKNLSQSS